MYVLIVDGGKSVEPLVLCHTDREFAEGAYQRLLTTKVKIALYEHDPRKGENKAEVLYQNFNDEQPFAKSA